MVCLVNRLSIKFYNKNENLRQIMEFPLTSQDNWIKWSEFSANFVVDRNVRNKYECFFREERLLSNIINSLLTSLVRSVQ